MCSERDTSDNNFTDKELFENVKEALLELCAKNKERAEYQLFKERIRKATSFKDLSQ